MTKYRIRLKTGRVIGPFIKNQLFELKSKGHIQGDEEAQVFPIGDWLPLTQMDFYEELMDENKTIIDSVPKEETFVIDLAKIRLQQNEAEIEKIDVTSHEPVAELTETVQLSSGTPPPTAHTHFELELDQTPAAVTEDPEIEEAPEEDREDKTLINPIAQEEIERMRRKQKAEEERIKAEEERKRLEEEERKRKEEEARNVVVDESTQMIRLDNVKNELLVVAQEEEQKIEKELKAIKKKERLEEERDGEDEESDEDESKNKRKKVIILVAIAAVFYAILFPSDEKPKKPPFEHLPPQIAFPIPFDKADPQRSKIELQKAKELFVTGTYPGMVKAGLLLKSSYENDLENLEAMNLLVRVYAEQLRHSKNKLADAQVIFNLIQGKRPFLANNPNGVIGMNLFYMAINKYEAAADVVAKYLKLSKKELTQDLFAVYLKSLIQVGKIDLAKQFHEALVKAPDKNRYTLEALIGYSMLNQEMNQAMEYIDDAIKKNPKLVRFYLMKADLLIREKRFKEVDPYLAKAEELNLEYNDQNRAKYLELKGLMLAYQGDVKKATAYFTRSLKIEDSDELRMRLADLTSSNDPTSETDKLIAESKAIKQLMLAKNFYEKRNYELALSAAARASDFSPGHIPSELFLSKVQLRLGLAKQGLETLEKLIRKYPEDKNINLALVDAYIDTYKFNDARNRIAIISGTDIKSSYEFASMNGKLYLSMGDSLQAISWLRNSINMNPLNDHDIYLLAEILIKRANFDAAKLLLNKCMELDPVNPDYRISYSKIVYELQDDQAAVGYLLGLLNEFGENPKILSEIAIFYYRSGKVKDFLAYKEKIEKLPFRDKALYEFLIKAALLDERYDEIPGLVEKLLQIEPGDIESMMTAGRVMYETGKLVEAAKWFKRIQEKLETYPKVQYYIAKIKYLNKEYDEAMADVKKDIAANGENDADLTLMAQIHVAKGELIEAENMFKKAQKINPRGYEALMGLAEISTKRNNFDLALDLYKKAMKEKGDEPIIHRKIGDVYRLLGQGSLAVEAYKLYLEMNPEAHDKNQIESYINLMK